DRSLRAAPAHDLLGSGSLHASVITGGQEYSSYPERCVLQAERRTLPGETVAQAEAELRELLEGLARDDPQFLGASRIVFSRDAFEIGADEPIVELVSRRAGTA